MSVGYFVYSLTLSFFLFGFIVLIISQILADEYGKSKIKDKATKRLLYGTYIVGLFCCLIGNSLHHSKSIPLWCSIYGLPPCFAVLGGSKAFLYGFFLRRAQLVAGTMNKYEIILFKRIAPIYIILYWMIYTILAGLFLTGKPIQINSGNSSVISWCIFNSWKWWFIILANSIDIFNCIASLLLFIIPLINTLKVSKNNNDGTDNNHKPQFIRAMKWNVFLTAIATISSIITLISIPIVNEYIWLFCAGDPFVNSLCIFLMIGSNRSFIKQQFRKYCLRKLCKAQQQEHETNVSNLEKSIETTNV